MSLRIVNAIDGTNPGFFKAFLVRFILTQIITSIPTIGALYFIIDPLFIFRNDRRCIHDLMAKTIVVDSKLHPIIKNTTVLADKAKTVSVEKSWRHL